MSTSVSKPVNFEPDATKIPEYYEKFFLKELKCRGLSNKRITMSLINKAWVLTRMASTTYFNLSDIAVIPEWTPFLKTMSFKLNFPTIIRNCRSHPAPPKSMRNIYTVLLNIKKMLNKIDMSSYIVSCDEAVYQICKEIQWKTKNKFDVMLFHLGGFHIAENLLGVIGKQMDRNGFSEILENMSSYGPTKVKGNVLFEIFKRIVTFSGHNQHCLSIVE